MRTMTLWTYALLLFLLIPGCFPSEEQESASTDTEESSSDTQSNSSADSSEEGTETTSADSEECPEEEKSWAGVNVSVACWGLSPGAPCMPCTNHPKDCYTCGDSNNIICEGNYIYCESPQIDTPLESLPEGQFICSQNLECTLVSEGPAYEACLDKATGEACWPCDQNEPECQLIELNPDSFFCDEEGQCIQESS